MPRDPHNKNIDWNAVQNKPSTFPSDWDSIANKPSSFGGDEAGDILRTYKSAPSGYLPCDGSVYLQSAYPDLYSAIGLLGIYTDYQVGGSNVLASSSRVIYGLIKFNGKYIAGGTNGRVSTSNTGISDWSAGNTIASNGTSHIFTIRNNDNVALLGGANGSISRTTDGTNWTAYSKGVSGDLNDLIYIPETDIWVGVGEFDGYILSDDDGLTWTYYAQSASWSYAWGGTAKTITKAFNKIFYFVGQKLFKADLDMSNISEVDISGVVNARDTRFVHFNGTTLVAGQIDQKAMITTDGVNFSSINLNFLQATDDTYCITYHNGVWIVVDTLAYHYSADLVSWTRINESIDRPHVLFDDGEYLFLAGTTGDVHYVKGVNGYDNTTSFQVPNLTENDYIKA